MNNAGMLDQVGGGHGRAMLFQIRWSSNDRAPKLAARSGHQGRVGWLTPSHGQVQSILDQIADLFEDHEIDGEAGVAAKQAGQRGCQQSGRARGQADPDLTGGRGALVTQSVYKVGRRIDDVPGAPKQILAINRQAQVARSAVKQASLETIFKVLDKTGDRGRGGVALPRDSGKRTGLNDTNERLQRTKHIHDWLIQRAVDVCSQVMFSVWVRSRNI